MEKVLLQLKLMVHVALLSTENCIGDMTQKTERSQPMVLSRVVTQTLLLDIGHTG